MTYQITIVVLLNALINIITTLSYSVKIVGIRTKRVALTFSLFNLLVLISRTANGFQAPLLASSVEKNLKNGVTSDLLTFQIIIFSCSISTLIGALLIPSFQRILTLFVNDFQNNKSILKSTILLLKKGPALRESFTFPKKQNFLAFKASHYEKFPVNLFVSNTLASAILTVGVLSSVYAGYLNPDFRTTASNLSAFINGFATILMFAFIDPQLSSLTDEVILGTKTQAIFRRYVVLMVAARLAGTLLAQLLFLPFANVIATASSKF